MLLARRPDLQEKILLLGRSARFEESRPEEAPDRGLAGAGSGAARRQALQRCAPRPKAPLLKVLLSNECPNHCHYCAFRVEAEVQRVSFSPDELAASFMELYERGLASGLFLSSGLGQDALRTMDDMLKTAEILRHGRDFQGYLHLKILPGATEQYVEAACRLADRVSANLEVPSAERLSALCPDKDFQHDLVDPLRLVAKIRRREGDSRPASGPHHPVRGGGGRRERPGYPGRHQRPLLGGRAHPGILQRLYTAPRDAPGEPSRYSPGSAAPPLSGGYPAAPVRFRPG